jgi:hypothetical protein
MSQFTKKTITAVALAASAIATLPPPAMADPMAAADTVVIAAAAMPLRPA